MIVGTVVAIVGNVHVCTSGMKVIAMGKKITSFGEFKTFREQRCRFDTEQQNLIASERVRAIHADLVRLVGETERLVNVLGDGAQRELANAAANNEITDKENLRMLWKSYERVSWRLHGQIGYMANGAGKK